MADSAGRRLRDLPGVLLKDLLRYRRALRRSGPGFRSDPAGWISLRNRHERLVRDPLLPGLRCDWAHGSSLHAPGVIPGLGRRVLDAALAEWPIRFEPTPQVSGEPAISFVFTHAGSARLPLLLRTIESINAQRGIACECIVVDQSGQSMADALPAHVRHLRLDNAGLPAGWRKAWGYNVGARAARADILVFHDGDVCVPCDYATEIATGVRTGGHGAVSLQRFLFYLDEAATGELLGGGDARKTRGIETIRQNWKGGTIAIRKDAFLSIGGFDEGFVDWGGEDDEFYDRCHEVGHCRSGYLPFVHLWHAPQEGRQQVTNPNIAELLPWRLSIPRDARVDELARRRFGDATGPDPIRRYGKVEPMRGT